MTRPPIVFDEGRIDEVTAAVIPIDGVTRVPVRGGVEVQLWDPVRGSAVPVRLVRNLSGALVLLNEPRGRELTFRIDASAAGYRGPLLVTAVPPANGPTRLVVPLERLPGSAFESGATLVRGSVVRSGVPVAGLTVSARPAADAAGHQFPATTDGRGVFALVVGLRLTGVTEPAPVVTTIRFEKADLPVREVDVGIDHGRTHVFADPIDLDGGDIPGFAP